MLALGLTEYAENINANHIAQSQMNALYSVYTQRLSISNNYIYQVYSSSNWENESISVSVK